VRMTAPSSAGVSRIARASRSRIGSASSRFIRLVEERQQRDLCRRAISNLSFETEEIE
jgi:hypothetical protein